MQPRIWLGMLAKDHEKAFDVQPMLFGEFPSARCFWFSAGSALGLIKDGKAVQFPTDAWVVRSKGLLADIRAALGRECSGEIDEQDAHIGMVRAKLLFTNTQGAFVNRLGLVVPAELFVHARLVVQRGRRLDIVAPVMPFSEFQYLVGGLKRFDIFAAFFRAPMRSLAALSLFRSALTLSACFVPSPGSPLSWSSCTLAVTPALPASQSANAGPMKHMTVNTEITNPAIK